LQPVTQLHEVAIALLCLVRFETTSTFVLIVFGIFVVFLILQIFSVTAAGDSFSKVTLEEGDDFEDGLFSSTS